MLCTVISVVAKQAENSNWYVNIVAQPENDPWSDELKYRMWCSEALAHKLEDNMPSTIELQKVTCSVEPYQRVTEDGDIEEKVFDKLSVVCRQHKGEFVDDPEGMAAKLYRQLMNDGKITAVVVDPYSGGVGDIAGND